MEPSLKQSIFKEITRARSLFEEFGRDLLLDPNVVSLLQKYEAAIGRTGELMKKMGINHTCACCAKEGKGSCCFPGIEEGYDCILLLINLLSGYSIPDSQEVEGSCIFVGARGCKLLARYYYCVHFLCPRLHGFLEPLSVKILLRKVGEELKAGWELEQVIRTWINKRDRTPS